MAQFMAHMQQVCMSISTAIEMEMSPCPRECVSQTRLADTGDSDSKVSDMSERLSVQAALPAASGSSRSAQSKDALRHRDARKKQDRDRDRERRFDRSHKDSR